MILFISLLLIGIGQRNLGLTRAASLRPANQNPAASSPAPIPAPATREPTRQNVDQ